MFAQNDICNFLFFSSEWLLSFRMSISVVAVALKSVSPCWREMGTRKEKRKFVFFIIFLQSLSSLCLSRREEVIRFLVRRIDDYEKQPLRCGSQWIGSFLRDVTACDRPNVWKKNVQSKQRCHAHSISSECVAPSTNRILIFARQHFNASFDKHEEKFKWKTFHLSFSRLRAKHKRMLLLFARRMR